MNYKIKGIVAEDIAVKFLKDHGYKILEQNFVCKLGEIDIIAENEGALCFIEVKYRKTNKYGTPFEGINHKKQKKIIELANYYIKMKKIKENINFRFDAVGIENNFKKITLIKDAFSSDN